MRLLTYNIHSGIGGSDRRYSLDRIAATIAEENPDLICLQEVDCNLPRSGHDDQPALLGRELKAVASFYQLNVPQDGGGYGNLVLSRWPFRQQHSVSLTRPRSRPRGAQLVVVQTPDGPLHLVNWHLSLSESDRRWQANHLLAHPLFLQSAHLPTLVVGDSNDWLDILEGHCFHQHQFQQATAPSSRFRSFPAYACLVSLDKVFYRGPVQVQEVRIIGSLLARQASDHRPLVLGFQLQPHPEQPLSSSNGHCAHARPEAPWLQVAARPDSGGRSGPHADCQFLGGSSGDPPRGSGPDPDKPSALRRLPRSRLRRFLSPRSTSPPSGPVLKRVSSPVLKFPFSNDRRRRIDCQQQARAPSPHRTFIRSTIVGWPGWDTIRDSLARQNGVLS